MTQEPTCQKCGEIIPWAYVPPPGHGPPENTDNGLHMTLDGGYGEFIDTWQGRPEYWLCHDCAHAFCEWLGIDPRNWHTHRLDSGHHPDHHDTD